MGFDSRAAGAMLSLGYRIFPFEAFDQSGNLVVPSRVDFPPDVEQGLGKIAANPLWKDLFRTMSPLQSHHKVFMAGIGLVNDRVQVAIFKSTTTVAGADEAMNWSESYHGTVEETLHRYAGSSYLLDPAWRGVVDKARASLPKEEQDVEVADFLGDFQLGSSDSPPIQDEAQTLTGVPWLAIALDLFAELVTKATVRTKVLTTVAWFAPQAADAAYAGRWKPIHATLQTGWLSGHRSAHLIWNSVGLPVTWRGEAVAWKGPGMDMPHDTVQWCQALRPLANCLGRPALELTEADALSVESA